jgi:hypothetical protein
MAARDLPSLRPLLRRRRETFLSVYGPGESGVSAGGRRDRTFRPFIARSVAATAGDDTATEAVFAARYAVNPAIRGFLPENDRLSP